MSRHFPQLVLRENGARLQMSQDLQQGIRLSRHSLEEHSLFLHLLFPSMFPFWGLTECNCFQKSCLTAVQIRNEQSLNVVENL